MGKGNHYDREARSRPIPTCPTCGSQAKEQDTKWGLRSWCCELWSWDRYPLVDAATHDARRAAHKAFDKLWKFGGVPRSRAYEFLARELGIPKDECHVKLLSREQAEEVPQAVFRIRKAIFMDELSRERSDGV